MEFNDPEGATPLDPNEIDGLMLTHMTTRSELNRWEQDNINEALAWIQRRRPKDILQESFMKQLHKQMFGNVWKCLEVGWRVKKNRKKSRCAILSDFHRSEKVM